MNKCSYLGAFFMDFENNDYLFNSLSILFKIFADPTRLKIIKLLCNNEDLCVLDIANKLQQTQSNISHQLSILKNNNVVKFIRSKKNILYSLSDDHISQIFKIGLEHIMEKI